jgi:hypothetical protein
VPSQFVKETIYVLDVARVPARKFERSGVWHGRHQVIHDRGEKFGGVGSFDGEHPLAGADEATARRHGDVDIRYPPAMLGEGFDRAC